MLKWLEGLSTLHQRYAKQYAKAEAMRELSQAERELECAIRRVALARIRAGQNALVEWERISRDEP